jgi:outer membrane autotransporter protein
MKQQPSSPLRKHCSILTWLVPSLIGVIALFSSEIHAAIGVADNYTIDASDDSETIVVTINDRLEIATEDAINYISIVSISRLSDPNAGSVQADPDDAFSINVFPTPGYSGVVTFTYQVRDIRGTSGHTTVTLNIVSSTPLLEAMDDHYITGRNPINIFPSENDIHPRSGYHVELLSQPTAGTLSTTELSGLLVYTPPADITDLESVNFDYRLVSDDNTITSTATVTIELDPTLDPIANAGEDEAQGSLANVLQVACDANAAGSISPTDPALADTCSALSSLSDSQLNNALEEILLRQVGAQANSMKGLTSNQIKNIGARLQELRSGVPGVSLAGLQANVNGEYLHLGPLLDRSGAGGGAGDQRESGRLGGFITGTLNFGDGQSRGKENSFDVDGQELLAGMDYRFNDRVVIGTAIGYSSSETKENGGDTGLDVDNWNLSFYGNYYPIHNGYVDWLLGYGESSIDTRRSINFATVSTKAKGDTEADNLSAAIGAGYTHIHQSWSLSTYTNLAYRSSTIDAYRERNDAGLDLNIYKTSTDTLTGHLGVRASNTFGLDFGVLIPQFELELVKDFKNEAPDIEAELTLAPEAGTFTLTNKDPDDSYINVGLSVTGMFKNGLSGFFRYSTMLAKDDISFDAWQLGARMAFGGPAEDINLFQSHENQGVGAGAFLGTTGAGVALSIPVRDESLNLRTVLALLPYNTDDDLDDVEYDIDLDMFSLGILLDWHPMNSGFRVSGGLFSLQPDITATAKPTEDVEIGNTTFTPEQVGTLKAEVDYSRNLAPYVGIGWGNAVKPDSKLTFSMDFGVMFTDNPTISIEANSTLANSNPALKAQLDSEITVEENRINSEDLDNFKLWPVISFGAAYHF